jgi:hypothetical protein
MKRQRNYILFLDESGKSKLSDIGNDFLLCGVVIDKDLHTVLSSYMVSLKDKSGISSDENIHAFDLFENEKVKGRKIKTREINLFFDRLCVLIQGAEIRCWTVRINKARYKKIIQKKVAKLKCSEKRVLKIIRKEGLHDFLYEALSRKIILEFGHFLEKEDAYGEVVAESRRQDDSAVLKSFIDATQSSKFKEDTRYHLWSKYSFKRLHSLIFQNKKGLSFGLEIADLFAWSHFNNHHGLARDYSSKAKTKRILSRLKKVDGVMKKTLIKDGVEEMTETKIKNVANDRVTEFTNIINAIVLNW